MKHKLLHFLSMIFGITLIIGGTYIYGEELADISSLVIVSHSEYWTGETGQIIGKLYDFRGRPISSDCNVTIYNPDKSIFLAPTITDDTLEAVDGTHYINFSTPSTEGVYEYKIRCDFNLFGKQQNRTISNSFHLNPALNTIRTLNGSIVGINSTINDIRNTMFSDIDAFNNFTQIQSNFSVVNQKLDTISQNISVLNQYCSNPTTNSSELCRLIWQNNQKIIAINQTLDYVTNTQLIVINQTTQNTYDFLIVNVTASFNDIVSRLIGIQQGINQINSTVNRIETKIDTNLTRIINNQEELIIFDVVS